MYYRITGVKYTLIPSNNVSRQVDIGGGSGNPGLLHAIITKKPPVTTAGTINSLDSIEVFQNPGTKRVVLTRPRSFYVSYPPTFIGGDAGQSVNYTAPKNQWISTNALGMLARHFPLHIIWDPFASNGVNQHVVRIQVKVYVKFKGIRPGDLYDYAAPPS